MNDLPVYNQAPPNVFKTATSTPQPEEADTKKEGVPEGILAFRLAVAGFSFVGLHHVSLAAAGISVGLHEWNMAIALG